MVTKSSNRPLTIFDIEHRCIDSLSDGPKHRDQCAPCQRCSIQGCCRQPPSHTRKRRMASTTSPQSELQAESPRIDMFHQTRNFCIRRNANELWYSRILKLEVFHNPEPHRNREQSGRWSLIFILPGLIILIKRNIREEYRG